MDRHNQWTRDPDCNPGAETMLTPDDAVRFRLSTSGREFEALVVRLAPEGEAKREAVKMIGMAIGLLMKE